MTYAVEFDFATVDGESEQEARDRVQDMLRQRQIGFQLRVVDWEKGKECAS